MHLYFLWWVILAIGLVSAILWYVHERGLAASFCLILLGALLNRLAVFVNGGQMPIRIDADGARLLWLCDIFYIPSFFQFSFGRTDITVRSAVIGWYYSIGDFMIFFGGIGIAAIVLWRTIKNRR